MKRDTSINDRKARKSFLWNKRVKGSNDKAKQYTEAKAQIFGVDIEDKDGSDQACLDVTANKNTEKSYLLPEVMNPNPTSNSNAIVNG